MVLFYFRQLFFLFFISLRRFGISESLISVYGIDFLFSRRCGYDAIFSVFWVKVLEMVYGDKQGYVFL